MSEIANYRICFPVSPSPHLNFWLGLLLLLILGKATYNRQRPLKDTTLGDGESLLRVMTTMEPLRSPPPLTSNGSNGLIPHENGTVEPTPIQPFDSSIFRLYLTSLLPPVLGASPDELDPIFDDEFEERVSRFAAEGGGVIYVVKVKDESEGEFHHLYTCVNERNTDVLFGM